VNGRIQLLLVASAIVSGVVSGCSTGAAPLPVPTGTGTTSVAIGATGGVLSGGGATLTVPAGALTGAGTPLTLSWAPATAGGYTYQSELFQFGPSGTTFASPALVGLPFVGDPQQASVYWSDDQGGYSELPVTVVNGLALAQVSHFSSGFVAIDSGFSTPESFWWVQVDGMSLRVPCPELDQDFTAPRSTGLFDGTSRSTGVNWGVDFPKDAATLASGTAPGTYAVVTAGTLTATAADLFGFQMLVPLGTSNYYSTAGAPASASSYHRITKVQLVSEAATTVTYRLWGSFQATMLRPGGPVPAQGGWSLSVTYPAPAASSGPAADGGADAP